MPQKYTKADKKSQKPYTLRCSKFKLISELLFSLVVYPLLKIRIIYYIIRILNQKLFLSCLCKIVSCLLCLVRVFVNVTKNNDDKNTIGMPSV